MITITLTCPLDGLPVGSSVAVRTGNLADIDGNFVRNPNQHIHEDISFTGTCANGHTFAFDSHVTLYRRA